MEEHGAGHGCRAGAILRPPIRRRRHVDLYLPLRGEFNGVAHEVDEDLAHTTRIAYEAIGHIGVHMVDDLEILLLRPHRERLHGGAEAIAQPEGQRLEIQLARLDLREVQDVVEQPEQGVGGVFDGGQKLLLVGGEVGVEREFGHAEDAIHGGPNLVAHVGQKLALRPIGGFGGFLGSLQRDVGRFERRRVGLQLLLGVGQFPGAFLHRVLQAAHGERRLLGHLPFGGQRAGQLVHFDGVERLLEDE